MIVFYISTWPSSSGLSKATVHPHLEELGKNTNVRQIFYFSTENHAAEEGAIRLQKVNHISIVRRKVPMPILRHIADHIHYTSVLERLANKHRPSVILCRGTPAGIYGYHLSQKFKVPFIVESYEPHADYMRHAGVWSPFEPKYIIQRSWEKKIKKHASALVTVSEYYRAHLERQEGIAPGRLFNVPCWVDNERFRFDYGTRIRMRDDFGVQERLVCIYVGKFGGLYYDCEAFQALATIKKAFGKKLFVLILSPDDKSKIENALCASGFAPGEFEVRSAEHDEIGGYLSAADFAVSFVKSTPSSRFCSAIKHGEYWACGLPVLLPPYVGEEADWVELENVGAVADICNSRAVIAAVHRILALMRVEGYRQRIRDVGRRKRGKENLERTYCSILQGFASAHEVV